MVEGARLESVYRLIAYRGFESLVLRHLSDTALPVTYQFQTYKLQIQTQVRV